LSLNQLISAAWTTGLARLLGAYGIRATIVYTLQVAATPFHQGLICLGYQYGVLNSFGCYRRYIESCSSTNVPHVVLDLSSDSMVQLKAPYLWPGEFSQIRTSDPIGQGVIALNNLTAVPAVAGMGAPTYQLYVHLEDIELFGCTPQATTSVTLNAGKKVSPVTAEFEDDAYPYSSALSSASKAIRFIGKGIPDLQWVAGPTSWALGKAAGVARYFGFGKPAVQDPIMRVMRQDNVGEWNTDVPTSSMVLAATASNTTQISTVVGASNVDEMSLAYILSRWAQVCYFQYDTSSASGTLLYVADMTPLAFWFRAPSALPATNKPLPNFLPTTGNSVQPSHLMFTSSCFKQWRGGYRLKFTFAKTKMHAGRVMVAFNPSYTAPSLTTAMTTADVRPIAVYGTSGPDPFAYSAVFDLKDGNVFFFDVPYISPYPYVNFASSIGTIALYVVNPLVAPSVVSNTVQVLVEISGASDFEVANPSGVMFPVHTNGTVLVQSGKLVSMTPDKLNQFTMGESITSVKQLISIPHANNVDMGDDGLYTIPPWFYCPTPSLLVPSVGTPLALSCSYGAVWSACYSYLKGGTDVHFYSKNKNTFIVRQLVQQGGYLPGTATPDQKGDSNACTAVSGTGVIHLRLPGFFATNRVFSWAASNLTAAGTSWGFSPTFTPTTSVDNSFAVPALYQLEVALAGTATFDDVNMLRNAADDAQMAMYNGPPPIFLPAGSAAGYWDPDALV
jgi:hypothetical protein